ncbi:hypothetical protein D556_0291 [Bordetella holmesii 41130]|nr:hypothetical protein D556_0291 [Bordetella holmesii 41130]
MFERLMNASRLNEGLGGGAWASTHPLSIERMSDVQNRIREQPSSRYIDSDDFWFIRAKMRVAQGRDAASLRTAQQQLLDESRALSGVRRAAAEYGLAYYNFLRNDLVQAQHYLDLAGAGGRTSPQMAKLAIDLAAARKDTARELALAQAAIKQWPDRRALGMAYAQALQDSGRNAEAQAYLRKRIEQWAATSPGFTSCWRKARNARATPSRRGAIWRGFTWQQAPTPRPNRSCSKPAVCPRIFTSSRR